MESNSMTILNSIVAKTLSDFKIEVDSIIGKGEKKDIAILQVIKRYITDSKKILFEGDGYSKNWEKEAEQRGLPNVKSVPYALDALVREKNQNLFEQVGVLSKTELYARHEIELEKYLKQIQIESRVIGDLATNHIIPIAIKYQNILIENFKGLKELNINSVAQENILNKIDKLSSYIVSIDKNVKEMVIERKMAKAIEHAREKAIHYSEKVKPYFELIRYSVDKIEQMVDDSLWTLPKYREILFLR